MISEHGLVYGKLDYFEKSLVLKVTKLVFNSVFEIFNENNNK